MRIVIDTVYLWQGTLCGDPLAAFHFARQQERSIVPPDQLARYSV